MWIGGGSVSIPGDPYRAGAGGPPPFNGNFADLFPGAYQVVQTDRGLSYGAVMRADTGNTSSVALALTGATPAVPVPIWIRITAPGVADIYYDGLGITPAMVGVTVVDSVQIILTGAGAGMGITPGVGSQVAGNTWRATCSGLADQSGNAKNYAQVTPARQPIVGIGLSGLPVLVYPPGSNVSLLSANLVPAPGTTPWSMFLLFRQVTWTNGGLLVHANTFIPQIVQNGVSPQIACYDGVFSPDNGGATLGAWVDMEISANNTPASTIKFGLTQFSGTMGNTAGGGGLVLGSTVANANIEVYAFVHAPMVTDWSAIRAAANALGAIA